MSLEGAGSQALTTMCTINFARISGLTYLHAPFSAIGHRPDGLSIDDYAAAWEAFFNLGSSEIHCHNRAQKAFRWNDYHFPGARNSSSNAPAFERSFVKLLPEFKRRYRLNAENRRDTRDFLVVAVHIRRGEVTSTHSYYTDTETVAAKISKVASVLTGVGKSFQVRVFSAGTEEEFSSLIPLGAQLHLNEDPIATMRNMIEADLLVTAKGAFSYVASLLSDGIIVSESSPYTPLNHWIICDKKGYFDATELERLLGMRS